MNTEPVESVSTLPPETEPRKFTLLVVDDEEGPRQSLRMVFRNDFNVHTVDSGEKALAYARDNVVHIAILDIRMSGSTGIEVLESLKAIDRRIEVIMLTAYETLETARQALRLGACDYLSKPFDLSTVRNTAARALHLRKISDTVSSTAERLSELNHRLSDIALREEMARTTNEIYAGVIHDINNPLTVISGYVQLLEERLKNVAFIHGDDLEKIRSTIDYIGKQVGTCTAIASRYLRFVTKNEAPGRHLAINQIIADLQALLNAHPEVRFNRLCVKPLDIDATPQIDATDLIQILLNLTINAFQSTDRKQTVWVVADTLDRAPDFPHPLDTKTEFLLGRETFKHQGPVISLSVLDQGAGISPETLPQIFDAYFTTKSHQGTGLGLAIVARLVQTHGALLHLKTRPKEGTTVTLYLPRQG
ncbi:MAG: response regulator [Opitutaceae bacterium]|nr:response regulator [Opitutaceae bacterium]